MSQRLRQRNFAWENWDITLHIKQMEAMYQNGSKKETKKIRHENQKVGFYLARTMFKICRCKIVVVNFAGSFFFI